MLSQRLIREFWLTCDRCDTDGPRRGCKANALAAAKIEGWWWREWDRGSGEDLCPSCQSDEGELDVSATDDEEG